MRLAAAVVGWPKAAGFAAVAEPCSTAESDSFERVPLQRRVVTQELAAAKDVAAHSRKSSTWLPVGTC